MSEQAELAFDGEAEEPLRLGDAEEPEGPAGQGGPSTSSRRRTAAARAAGALALLGLAGAAAVWLLALRSGRGQLLELGQTGGELVRSDVAVPESAPVELAALHTDWNDGQFCEKEYKHAFGCTYEARINKKKGYGRCCRYEILPKLLFFDKRWENYMPPMSSCALVGSSSLLLGKGKGWEIDSHSVVIRINRISRNGFKHDFGEKASIIMMAVTHQLTGKITLMGDGDGIMTPCDWNPNCKYAGLTFLQGRGKDCPLKTLKHIWGTDHHHFIGCPSKDLVELAYQLKSRTNDGWKHTHGVMSTGFVGILQFAPLCKTLDVYGFGGVNTADGHVEWDGHPLELEHNIEHQLAGKRYWDVDNTADWLWGFWANWKKHAGKITMK